MVSTLLLQLTKGVWAIEPKSASTFLPVVKSLLKGEKRDFSMLLPKSFENDDDRQRKSYAKGHNIYVVNMDNGTYMINNYSSPSDAPTNSISVLPILGAIMKYDYCDSPGTTSMDAILKEADASENIIAHILLIDSPGGAADGTLQFSESIKSLNKPVYALINGMCASAAYWIASSAKEIYASSKVDVIGSIGTYLTLIDYSAQLEADGIKVHEIYATKSTDKNADYATALKGEYDAIRKNMIDPFNEAFLGAVKKNRGMRSSFNAEETLTGKTFYSPDAIKYGLVDGITSMAQLIKKITSN